MPCLFLYNVPEDIKFDPSWIKALHQSLADVIGGNVGDVEIHLVPGKITLLMPDGSVQPAPNVHVFVDWHAGRSEHVKEVMAGIIHWFLDVHGIGNDSDITFRDSPPGTFYMNGQRVEGGDPTINFRYKMTVLDHPMSFGEETEGIVSLPQEPQVGEEILIEEGWHKVESIRRDSGGAILLLEDFHDYTPRSG